MEEKKVQVRFPLDVWETLKELAENHERSFNGEVVWGLRAYIAQVKGGKHENVQISPLSDQETD